MLYAFFCVIHDLRGGHGYVCDGDTVQCRGEEGEPWDDRDLSIVFQVAVFFP
jgi:hypothetical protein